MKERNTILSQDTLPSHHNMFLKNSEQCVRPLFLSLHRKFKYGGIMNSKKDMKNENEMKNMKKENDIKVEMVRVEGDVMPFIKVDYLDRDAQEHTGLMILDSCCQENILTHSIIEVADLQYQQKDEDDIHKVITLCEEDLEVKEVDFSFAMGGRLYHEEFLVSDQCNQLPQIKGKYPTIGILGNIFFLKHNLAVDFSDFTLHTSHATPENLPISDCEFFFPMEIGLKSYGLPVLSIRKDGKDIVAMADSGATNNMIASQTIEEHGFDCQYLEKTEEVLGLTGEIETPKAMIGFSLLTLAEDDKVCEVSHKETFNIFPRYIMVPKKKNSDNNSEQLPPVEAMISSTFMAKEGWVLDFGIKFIYKRKVFSEKMNPRVMVRKKSITKHEEDGMNASMRNRKIRFFADATETGVPFIRIEEGDFEGIVMLLDTGSNDNVMFGYAYHQLKGLMKPVEGQRNVYGIDGKIKTVNIVSGIIPFCGRKYEMNFLVREDNEAAMLISKDMGFPVSGIIGTNFLVEHGWMLDFGKQEVVIPAMDISTSDWEAVRKNKRKE